MTTIARIIDLNDITTDTPTDLTCGGVFHVFAHLNPDTHEARIEMTAEEGRGKVFCYKASKIESLKDLAEKLRMALFSINCDLSWSGRASMTRNTVEIEAAHQRNYKTQSKFFIIHHRYLDLEEWSV